MKSRDKFWVGLACLGATLASGCTKPSEEKTARKGIFGQKTQEIAEYKSSDEPDDKSDKPNTKPDEEAVAEQDKPSGKASVKPSINPLAPVGVYGSVIGKLSQLEIEKALQLFNAVNGRYPKDHAEFMERIIDENKIKLHVLPGKAQYQYDVEKHTLRIVKKSE